MLSVHVTHRLLLVGDLHAEGLFVLVFVIIDVDEDFLFTSALTWGKPQADGVRLPSTNLRGTSRGGWG